MVFKPYVLVFYVCVCLDKIWVCWKLQVPVFAVLAPGEARMHKAVWCVLLQEIRVQAR